MVEAGRETKEGSSIQKTNYCVFIEVHKQPRFTCQSHTTADSSLTPSVALLECPSGTIHCIVDCHEFLGSQK